MSYLQDMERLLHRSNGPALPMAAVCATDLPAGRISSVPLPTIRAYEAHCNLRGPETQIPRHANSIIVKHTSMKLLM